MVSLPVPRLARAQGASLLLHVGLIASLLLVSTQPASRRALRQVLDAGMPLIMPRLALLDESGRGGGGDRSPLPASQGRLPKLSRQPLAPAAQVPPRRESPLMVEPAILAQTEAVLPSPDLPHFGDPLAPVRSALSNGRGSRGGIGDGEGTGVGNNRGPGYGDTDGPGAGGSAAVPMSAAGLTRPVLVFKTEPEYSEEARRSRWQGMVSVEIVIGEDGVPRNVQVLTPLGRGLDEKAVEAVRQWRFRAGRMNGRAVPVTARVEVYFRLL